MKETYIADFERIKERFEAWWSGARLDRPLMRIVAAGKPGPAPLARPEKPETIYLDPDYIAANYRNYCETHVFLADAYPEISADIGPGSMALYLGGEPEFAWDTVWYQELLGDSASFRTLHYSEDNKWWVLHQALMEKLKALAGGDFMVNIPDIIENADILSALRGPSNLCFDLMDAPEDVKAGVEIIDSLYFRYYDRFYDMLKEEDGASSFTAFHVLGQGRVAKIQCDFCALISPQSFRELIQPSLQKQCRKLDHSIYHLDGPDAIKHLPALMEIKELQALQWTCGAGKPDGGCEDWYPIYDKVREAGKSLWIQLYDGTPKDWANSVRRLVKRYGRNGMYFLFEEFPDAASAREMAELF